MYKFHTQSSWVENTFAWWWWQWFPKAVVVALSLLAFCQCWPYYSWLVLLIRKLEMEQWVLDELMSHIYNHKQLWFGCFDTMTGFSSFFVPGYWQLPTLTLKREPVSNAPENEMDSLLLNSSWLSLVYLRGFCFILEPHTNKRANNRTTTTKKQPTKH